MGSVVRVVSGCKRAIVTGTCATRLARCRHRNGIVRATPRQRQACCQGLPCCSRAASCSGTRGRQAGCGEQGVRPRSNCAIRTTRKVGVPHGHVERGGRARSSVKREADRVDGPRALSRRRLKGKGHGIAGRRGALDEVCSVGGCAVSHGDAASVCHGGRNDPRVQRRPRAGGEIVVYGRLRPGELVNVATRRTRGETGGRLLPVHATRAQRKRPQQQRAAPRARAVGGALTAANGEQARGSAPHPQDGPGERFLGGRRQSLHGGLAWGK